MRSVLSLARDVFLQGTETETKKKKNEKYQILVIGLFHPPAPSFSSPTSLHTLFLAPRMRTGRSAVPAFSLPSQVSTPQAFPVALSLAEVAAAAAEGEALEIDQKHLSASLHVVLAILITEEEEEATP
jgi:hypothetical protein